MIAGQMKSTKREVRYSEGTPKEHCGNCERFRLAMHACTKVQGTIEPRYWCTLWTATDEDPHKH